MPRVYLNPDGASPVGLAVIVSAATGVIYGTQCGGVSTQQRELEGFLVLCPSRDYDVTSDVEAELEQRFRAHPSWKPASTWAVPLVDELAAIVRRVVFWRRTNVGEDVRERLSFDRSRLGECVEAWIPVLTPEGPGVLTFENSD
jgi:hypothetical protein